MEALFQQLHLIAVRGNYTDLDVSPNGQDLIHYLFNESNLKANINELKTKLNLEMVSKRRHRPSSIHFLLDVMNESDGEFGLVTLQRFLKLQVNGLRDSVESAILVSQLTNNLGDGLVVSKVRLNNIRPLYHQIMSLTLRKTTPSTSPFSSGFFCSSFDNAET